MSLQSVCKHIYTRIHGRIQLKKYTSNVGITLEQVSADVVAFVHYFDFNKKSHALA